LNPIDVVISGTNLETQGFLGLNFATAGIGLLTFGFLFPCDEHWVSDEIPITTTWENCLDADSSETCTD